MSTIEDRLSTLTTEQKAELQRTLTARKQAVAASDKILLPEEATISFAQESLWFLDQLAPERSLYNIPVALKISGSLNIQALERSFQLLVDRHLPLRTVIGEIEGQPHGSFLDAPVFKLQRKDFTGCWNGELEKHVQSAILAEADRPFNLQTDLMIRGSLLQLPEEKQILLITVHHIAADQWSLNVIFRELSEFYPKFCRNETPASPPLSVTYPTLAREQRRRLDGTLWDQQIGYWKNRLHGVEDLHFPVEHPRPKISSYRGARVTCPVSKRVSEAIKDFARDHGSTVYMTLLAGFKGLLARYTQSSDIIIGSPIAGRTRTEWEAVVGFFVNTVPLRTRVEAGMSFKELLASVSLTLLEAFDYQDVPFEKLVEELKVPRDTARNPLFQIVFQYQPPAGIPVFSGLEIEMMDTTTSTSKFDLNFCLVDRQHAMVAEIEYATDLFSEGFIRRMAVHLENFLEAAVREPEMPLSKLPLIGEQERTKLLIDWNQTRTEFPRKKTIHQMVAEASALHPDQVAIEYGLEKVTCRELEILSNRVASSLMRVGVAPGAFVGVCAERSPQMVAAWLGILKAGAAYVPLDADYPVDRLKFMVEDSGAKVILASRHLCAAIVSSGAEILELEPVLENSMGAVGQTPDVSSMSPAYMIYTSGSTGKPKGVVVPHRAVLRLLVNTNFVQISSADRMAQISNASFDAITFEVWGALFAGARLIGLPKETILDPLEFADALHRTRINTMFITVALFNQVSQSAPHAFRHCKNVLVGGDALDPRSIREILLRGKPQRLLNGYGPTECTTFAAWHEIRDISISSESIPIGRPISNTQFYVLDRSMEPVPIGLPGELYLGGEGVALGYHNRPELNAEKFVPNPFASSTPGLLYRTGDLVRYQQDGVLQFLGRIDHQVKIRGFRIELGEIESALLERSDVRQAVVMAREDLPGGKCLVAYVVAASQSARPENIRADLKLELPEYMVPAHIVFLEQLPLTPNGKIDRQKLAAPEAAVLSEGSFVAPRGGLERKLQAIFQKVLGVEKVGARDNFFDLGGHSLLAVKLFSAIEKELGKKLPVMTLFKHPTVSELADIIRSDGFHQPGSVLVEIQPYGENPPIFWLHTLGGGGGGGLFTYRKLAGLLGPNQPSYGLVAPSEPYSTVETMAAGYIVALKQIQPAGPYFLGGYCFGGVVAYEMARQLEEQGEQLGLVALIDCRPPHIGPAKGSFDPELLLHAVKTLPHFFDEFRDHPEQMMARIQRKGQNMGKRIMNFFSDSKPEVQGDGSGLNEVIDMSQYPKDYKRFAEIHWNALSLYHPKSFGGRVTLFRTTTCHLFELEPEDCWARLALGGVDVRLIEGTHEKILEEPCVSILADHLKNILSGSAKRSDTPNISS